MTVSHGQSEGRTTCTHRSEAHFVPGIISHIEVDGCIQRMNGNFLTSKDERHVDLLVARQFPDASNIRSIDELCTRDAAIHGVGKGPESLISIVNLVQCMKRLLGDLRQRKPSIKHGS